MELGFLPAIELKLMQMCIFPSLTLPLRHNYDYAQIRLFRVGGRIALFVANFVMIDLTI